MSGFIARQSKNKNFDLQTFFYDTRYTFLVIWFCAFMSLLAWAIHIVLAIVVSIVGFLGLILFLSNFAYSYVKAKKFTYSYAKTKKSYK